MTKILIPVELEDGKSCEGCRMLIVETLRCEPMPCRYRCHLGYTFWASDMERPQPCIDELGGGE